MGQEIERKYLVKHNRWQQIDKPAGTLLRQGYLLIEPDKTIRIRQTTAKGFLTIKGRSIGATRSEYEYEIPLNEAIELLNNFSISELSKTRYRILCDNKIWEVDEFLGDNFGLIVAENELTSEDETFNVPGWIANEITGEEKYCNSSLTTNPYKNWKT